MIFLDWVSWYFVFCAKDCATGQHLNTSEVKAQQQHWVHILEMGNNWLSTFFVGILSFMNSASRHKTFQGAWIFKKPTPGIVLWNTTEVWILKKNKKKKTIIKNSNGLIPKKEHILNCKVHKHNIYTFYCFLSRNQVKNMLMCFCREPFSSFKVKLNSVISIRAELKSLLYIPLLMHSEE